MARERPCRLQPGTGQNAEHGGGRLHCRQLLHARANGVGWLAAAPARAPGHTLTLT